MFQLPLETINMMKVEQPTVVTDRQSRGPISEALHYYGRPSDKMKLHAYQLQDQDHAINADTIHSDQRLVTDAKKYTTEK